jgi:hypothetical protein
MFWAFKESFDVDILAFLYWRLFGLLSETLGYEKHVLFESSKIYYWIYKCTTCLYCTNIIKNGLIKLIKTRKCIYKMWKGLA